MAERLPALVLSGGGARGALQVGALRALHETGYRPDLIVGTSVGAMNAAVLGLHGMTAAGIAALEAAWRAVAASDLVPPGYLWLTLRTLFGRRDNQLDSKIRAFLIEQGIGPSFTFHDLKGVPVRIVAADLRAAQPVVYGADPAGNVLEAILASTAIPPWVHPLEDQGHLLLDGGAVSNLPIESALAAGATEITALDLCDPRSPFNLGDTGEWTYLLLNTVHRRQAALEMALAEARGVPVRLLRLRCSDGPVSMWDFQRSDELMAEGYALAREQLDASSA